MKKSSNVKFQPANEIASPQRKISVKNHLLAVVVAALLTGCFEKKIDGTTDATLKASIDEIANGLTDDQREEFRKSVIAVAMQSANFGAMYNGKQTAESFAAAARAKLDGRTATEVIQMTEDLEANRPQ